MVLVVLTSREETFLLPMFSPETEGFRSGFPGYRGGSDSVKMVLSNDQATQSTSRNSQSTAPRSIPGVNQRKNRAGFIKPTLSETPN